MKTNDTTKREEARKKRAALKDLSNQLKKLADMGSIPPSEDGTVNGLLRYYYQMAGYTELKTFGEWKKLGYSVKKGAKALLLWGKPKKHDKPDEATETATDDKQEDKKDEFFPVAYLFSQAQVIKK